MIIEVSINSNRWRKIYTLFKSLNYIHHFKDSIIDLKFMISLKILPDKLDDLANN